MGAFTSFTEIIDALGGSAAFGAVIGAPVGTASAMKTRDVIPPAHWSAVVREAARAGIGGISHDLLASLYSAKKAKRAPTSPTPSETPPQSETAVTKAVAA